LRWTRASKVLQGAWHRGATPGCDSDQSPGCEARPMARRTIAGHDGAGASWTVACMRHNPSAYICYDLVRKVSRAYLNRSKEWSTKSHSAIHVRGKTEIQDSFAVPEIFAVARCVGSTQVFAWKNPIRHVGIF
jgi:hypothetical protein